MCLLSNLIIFDKHESTANEPARIECNIFYVSKVVSIYYYYYDKSRYTPELLALGNRIEWNLVIRSDIFFKTNYSKLLESFEFYPS